MKAGELSVNWRYSEDRQSTTCMVSRRDGGTLTELASVTIRRHYKDQFEYEKARKNSMKRALQVVGIPKEQRAAIWDAYFARKPQK